MNLIVTGSRFGHPDVDRWLDGLLKRRGRPGMLFEGAARGVDEQARSWARRNGIENFSVAAHWDDGPGAGPARNKAMVALCKPGRDVLVAFPDVQSRGTWDCYLRGLGAGLECFYAPAVRYQPMHQGVAQYHRLGKEETELLMRQYQSAWRG